MGIFSRTRDIFAANFTELLDRAEDPARMIRMIILEMEETLVEVRASAARSIADGKEMRRAISRLDELQSSWTEKAELALSKDREDLAKAALMERQKAADMAGGLTQRAQPLRKRRDIGNRRGAYQPPHDLPRIGPERLDQIAEKTFLTAKLAQCLDPAWIDNRRRLAGKPWMRGDRRYAIAERRRSISCASRPWCVLRQPLPTRRRVGAERQSVQGVRQQLRV